MYKRQVSDNGRGVPVDMHQKGVSAARLVYTTLHAGGKFDDSAYKTSGGLHGVGSSVVNALSTYMDVKISRDGFVHHDRYERGIPVIELEDGLLPKIGKTRKTGTTVNSVSYTHLDVYKRQLLHHPDSWFLSERRSCRISS